MESETVIESIDRATAIARIRTALQARSGKRWSVTGGRGTAYGWITIDAPPNRRTARWIPDPANPANSIESDTGLPNGHITPDDRKELATLLGLATIHHQGVSIPASRAYYREHVDRAEGRAPSVIGEPYWD